MEWVDERLEVRQDGDDERNTHQPIQRVCQCGRRVWRMSLSLVSKHIVHAISHKEAWVRDTGRAHFNSISFH